MKIRKKQLVQIKALVSDEKFQSRTRTDEGTLADYKDAMSNGASMPPIVVADVDGVLFIVDGWHRVSAALALGWLELEAFVEPMTINEAVWEAASANKAHGLRRSNADKIRAVEMVFALDDTASVSDREIARRIGVSHEFVRQHRSRGATPDTMEGDDIENDVDDQDDGDDRDSDGDVEPQSPKDSTPKDALFDAKHKYLAIIAQFDAVRAALTLLQTDPDGYSINWNALDADTKNAKRCLTDAMPHAPCCYCNGDGCDACKATGWLGKIATEMAPKNLKKGRK